MAKNPKIIELAGQHFGKWFVISQAGNSKRGGALWLCKCACGTEKVVIGGDLRHGKSLSCGCKGSRATIGLRSATHRMKGTRIHNCWSNMLGRCKNMANKSYGGKGITVCEEWKSFECFYEWSTSSGYSDHLTIERLDNSAGYYPENCTWADRTTQARNRTIVNLAPDGRSWAEIAEDHGVPVGILNNRISAGGWPIEVAATWPVGKRRAPPNNRDSNGRITSSAEPIWRR